MTDAQEHTPSRRPVAPPMSGFVCGIDGSPESLRAARQAADGLVVGSRGAHGVRALGSVSEAVAHRSPASVLIVRPSDSSPRAA